MNHDLQMNERKTKKDFAVSDLNLFKANFILNKPRYKPKHSKG